MPRARAATPRVAAALLPLVCFFASGFVSLLYEICWIRKASLAFGATGLAVSTVVAVFFGGMALGSYLFGRYCRRAARPLRVYAQIEIALGVLAALTPAALIAADGAYGRLYPGIENHQALLATWRAVLISLVLLPPTILIGGTLPLFCQEFVRSAGRIGRGVGLLYACNTLGAAIGCAVTGLWLIPHVGVNASIWLGAVANVAIGVAIWFHPAAAKGGAGVAAPEPPAPGKRARPSQSPAALASLGAAATVTPALFFLSGFAALGNEILWTRYLSLLVRNTVYTYTLSLTIVLAGIVLGSALVAGLLDRLTRRALLFGLLNVVGGLLVLGLLLAPPSLWRSAVNPTSVSASLWVFVAVLLPPAVLSGAAFPLAIRMVLNDPALAGMSVGRMTALNTLGGILGSLSAGFVLLPLLGMHVTLLLLTGLALLIGFAAWALLERELSWWLRGSLVSLAALAWLATPLTAGTRLPQDFLAERGTLVDFREGLGSHLAVVRRNSVLRLEIDLLWQGQDRKCHQVMAAHIPMLIDPGARRVAVIGLGTGQTGSRFLMHPIERLDCVDIEARLVDLVRRNFDSDWMNDPRVRLIIEDGRSYLAHTRNEYDLVAIEVGQIFRPGLASFYTLDFYEQAARRLRPGGAVCQFVPLAAFTPDEFRTVLRTFIDVFPDSTLWYNTSELLLIGRRGSGSRLRLEPSPPLGAPQAVLEDIRFAHWGGPGFTLDRPEVFMGGLLCGPEGLRRLARDVPAYRDERPFLEYTTCRYLERGEVAIVELLRSELQPLPDMLAPPPDEALASAAASVRDLNLRNVIAAAYERSALELAPGQTARQIELLETAVTWNPLSVQLNRVLGDALLLGGRTAEAVASYRMAVALDPGSARARHHLGRGLYLMREFAESAEHLRAALAIEPDDADAHNNLAAALAALGDLDGAVRHFSEAVRLRPSNPELRNNLSKALDARQRRGGAGSP
jgi:spermidine synthase